MTVTSWTRRSPRGAWHVLNLATGRALCGTQLGWGPSSFTSQPTSRCRRCCAQLDTLAAR